jgi:hypothetical protein
MQFPKKIIVLIIFMSIFMGMVRSVLGQEMSNLRIGQVSMMRDTVIIDTFSIIPGSIRISRMDGSVISEDQYKIDYATATLIWRERNFLNQESFQTSAVITYRVYPFLFTQSFSHKAASFQRKDIADNNNPYIYSYTNSNDDVFKFGGLNKNGSISRGVSFGNNQDIVVNSSLNLQLSGKLSEDVGILAAITDNNIPIQPEGNTQQIQEFDKVYIQLFTKKTHLTAGDFELQRPLSYFMNLTKKAQGGLLNTNFEMPKTAKGKSMGNMDVTVSGAISKGKYAKNTLISVEGNQGPYKLTGANGETYIIILAGTEKAYIDGKLLTRGADNDYTIDYNLGEITFTPQIMITKDKRIVVEFEYSDKNYARSMYSAATDYKGKHGDLRFNFYSEQDLKNQPVQQELTDAEKELLFNIGDSLSLAIVPNVVSVEFNSSEVLYKMVDTVVNSVHYDSIYVYSTNADSAHYRLGFASVGQGNGNYIQVQSSANGKVFQWVAPQGGVPQGTHEPVILLIAPKRTQMYTMGGDLKIGRNTLLSAEVALSNKDENTFSPLGKYDDIGYAARFNLQNILKIGRDSIKGWSMLSGISHEYVQQYFSPIERFRSVEFDRDWNLGSINNRADEQNPGLEFGFKNRMNQFVIYRFKSFLKGSSYKGFRHTLDAAYDIKRFYITANASYLSTQSISQNSRYYRYKAILSKKFKWFTIGVGGQQENNSLLSAISDTLTPSSFAFEEYEAFLTSPDTALTKFHVTYKRRYDRLPRNGGFTKVTTADDASAGVELTKNPNNLLKFTSTFRQLQIHDTTLSAANRENSLLGRIEFFTRKVKKVITSNTYYEIGSGLEVKKEFSYLEVAAGQGLYTWTDYNANGVKELNEFEVAAFADQANYIRVFTPTNEYIKAYYSQFSEALNIEPAVAWANKKGIRKFISRFAIQGNYHIERKTSDENLWRAYNPFQSSVGDTNLLTLNSSFRGTLFFNRSNPKLGMEVIYQDSRNKSLLVNGFDSRISTLRTGRIRWNITRKLMLSVEYNNGIKTSKSDYFPGRDYRILYYDIQPKISYQPGNLFRLSVTYKYAYKKNKDGDPWEIASQHNAGLEIKYNFPAKGSLSLKGNFINISYNADQNNSLAYEMLEGFKKGNNITWSLSYQRNLSEYLQLNLLYEGRQTPGNKMVHVGSVQLRAYF